MLDGLAAEVEHVAGRALEDPDLDTEPGARLPEPVLQLPGELAVEGVERSARELDVVHKPDLQLVQALPDGLAARRQAR